MEDIEVEKWTNLKVPNNPTKEHAEFNGWYLDKELTKEFDFGTVLDKNIKLYARWINYHLVKFITVGGTKVEDQYVKDGYNAEYVSTEREGYKFDGWYCDTDYLSPFNFGKPITEDVYVYARWI